MTRKETIHNVEHFVIGEELLHLRSVTNDTHQFWSKWKSEKYALLFNQLGFKTQAM